MKLCVTLAGLLLALVAAAPAGAAPAPSYDLTLNFNSPVWSHQSGLISDAYQSEFGGKLILSHVFNDVPLLSRVSPFVSGAHTLGSTITSDNRLQAGVEYALSNRAAMVSYWDRFTDQPGNDRVWVGIRYGLHGRL